VVLLIVVSLTVMSLTFVSVTVTVVFGCCAHTVFCVSRRRTRIIPENR
jgi:hypothetical protein